jgi:hypothetical protein
MAGGAQTTEVRPTPMTEAPTPTEPGRKATAMPQAARPTPAWTIGSGTSARPWISEEMPRARRACSAWYA